MTKTKKPPRDLSGLIDMKRTKERTASQPVAVVATTDERRPASWRVRPKAKKQFSILARQLDRTEQDLLAEAMNMVFEKYERDPIA